MTKTQTKQAVLVALVVCFVGAQMLAPTYSLADVLRCTIENYGEDVYITTPPDTNSSDGQYARIGISRGIGNRAIVVADRMGATAFVELNADDTPIGLLTLQKDLRVIKSRQSIDTNGMVFAPEAIGLQPGHDVGGDVAVVEHDLAAGRLGLESGEVHPAGQHPVQPFE